MKKLVLRIMTIIIIVSSFFLSCQKIDEVSKLDKQVAAEIASDEIFHDMAQESKEFLGFIKSEIIAGKLSGTGKIQATQSIDELNQLLGLPDNYLKSNYESISFKCMQVIEKFKLKSKSEKEIANIFHQISTIEKSPYEMVNLKSSSCQEKFESDFDRIHRNFDTGVYLCLLAGVYGGVGGVTTCEAINVYRTVLAIAEAIDDYNECVANE